MVVVIAVTGATKTTKIFRTKKKFSYKASRNTNKQMR